MSDELLIAAVVHQCRRIPVRAKSSASKHVALRAGSGFADAAAAVDVERPAVEGQLPHLLLDDVRRVSGSASSAGEGINDSIVDE